jgi:hypothetical protein
MADVFRVPLEVTYAIEGGEPALLAYRRWRNISRDDLAAKSGIPKEDIEAIEVAKRTSRRRCSNGFPRCSKCPRTS